MSLTRVRLTASLVHLRSARNLAVQGNKDEALKEYEKALSYDPQNSALYEEMRRLTEAAPPKEKPEEERLQDPAKLKRAKTTTRIQFTTRAPPPSRSSASSTSRTPSKFSTSPTSAPRTFLPRCSRCSGGRSGLPTSSWTSPSTP